MAKQSLAAKSIAPINASRVRLAPRPEAPDEVREIFREIVGSVKADHFRPSDNALMEQYAQAVALARRAYRELEASGTATFLILCSMESTQSMPARNFCARRSTACYASSCAEKDSPIPPTFCDTSRTIWKYNTGRGCNE